ncbi:MAG: PEGA domain-containing protein [Vicinamibacterales bacterium]
MIGALVAIVFGASAVTSEAQVRGHGRGRTSVVVVGGGFYSPYYYDPFFFADPWYGGYQYPIRPYGYGYRFAEADASVRLEVTPKEAEVFVDGYYAGVVDDFDGTFQRLHVPPGEHEIELWLDGYRTVRQKVYLTPDNTFKVKYQMERLASGQAPEPKPQPVEPPQVGNQPRMQPPMGRGPMMRRIPPDQMPPPQPPPDDPRSGPDNPRGGQRNASYGTLAIKVQPADAEVSIDGENWRGPGAQDRLTVEVSEGSHTVEIRKAGFRTYVTQVDVRRGQTTPLNVSLRGE